ncbi:unnamed protein product [Brassica rapa subsp. narinosa]
MFYTIWGCFSSWFSLYTKWQFGETCGNQLQHKQLTFPLCEQLGYYTGGP